MKLYFYVSRTLREGQFPFSLLPTRSARIAVARLTLLLSLIFAGFISTTLETELAGKRSDRGIRAHGP